MTTISVPLSLEQAKKLEDMVRNGVGENRAQVMRKALERLAEEEAIRVVLEAQREVTEGKIMRGDLRKILKIKKHD